jgi:hypothetical protein
VGIGNVFQREWALKLAVPAASAALALLALELGVRLRDGELEVKNHLGVETNLFKSAYPVSHDAVLGWIPRSGAAGIDNVWRTDVTIRADGTRSNGRASDSNPPNGPELIVAVGDSFTFGDEVSDADTWPAVLERLTGIRTVNGGVFGYGIDQSYLRARQLIEAYAPSVLVFSFIPDDVARTELSERTSVQKPYFEVRDGELVLRNTPVPPPRPDGFGARLRPVKELASRSYLVHDLMSRMFPAFWFNDAWRDVRAHEDGVGVSCRLLRDLEREAAESGIALVVLAQYQFDSAEKPDDLAMADRVIGCLDRATTKVIDLRRALASLRARDPARFESYFADHMTAAGNRFVAAHVFEEMSGNQIGSRGRGGRPRPR